MKDYEAPSRHEAEELNQQIRYLSYSVFRVAGDLGDLNREDLANELTEAISQVDNVVVRGIYDVSVFRADADIMFWYHAPAVEDLQKVYAAIRTSALGSVLEPVWSVVGIHRPAEFNRSHVPAFLTDDDPG